VAEGLYRRVLHLADHVQNYDAAQIYGNYLELLNRRGDTAQIDAAVARLKARPDAGGFARARGEINVASAWLWRGNPAACARELADLAEDMADDADIAQQIEWATLWLKLHVRHGVPYDEPVITALAAHPTAVDDSPLDTAQRQQLRGLLAAARGDSVAAQDALGAAHRLFSDIGFAYSAAATTLWQAEVAVVGGIPVADAAHKAISLLEPFGATPAIQRARELLARSAGA
jgi:hypothetical protein